MNTECSSNDSWRKIRNAIIFLWVFILSSISFVSRAESSDVLIKRLVPNVIIAKNLMGQSDPKAPKRFNDSVNLAKTLIVQNPDQIKFQDNVGIILAKALEDGLGSEAALLPMQNLREEFDADVYLRVKQGIDTIILNILYKSDKWSEGFNIIKRRQRGALFKQTSSPTSRVFVQVQRKLEKQLRLVIPMHTSRKMFQKSMMVDTRLGIVC